MRGDPHVTPTSVVAGSTHRDAPAVPTRAQAFRYWLRLGFISFGGPAGQIAIMHRELVDERRWISERRFLHALNYCMLLPGPEAQQLATYIGWLMHRTLGGLAAGILFVLPSLVLLILLSWIYVEHGDVPAVAAAFAGVKPVVVAIVAHAAWRVGSRALRHPLHWGIALAAFVALFVLSLPFPLVVVGAAVVGLLAYRTTGLSPGHASAPERSAPSAIDDDTPPPDHARFSRARSVGIVTVFLAVGMGAYAAVRAVDPEGGLAHMAVFFTQAALVTFGGAYAVLPYVNQAAVEHYQWLTAAQMIDGLALGETTPGPLIMIVAFVGFVGAWTHAMLGADMVVASGIAGACVATFFTFLPSFLFILAGGPLVESTRDEPRLVAPLAAVTAAVVGVIANLAVFFAGHVFLPGGRPDAWAIAIGVAAAVALFRYRIGIIPLILGGAVAGLAWALARGSL